MLEVIPLCALKRISLSHSNQHFYLVFWPAGADAPASGSSAQQQADVLDSSAAVLAALEDFSALTILNVLVGNLEKCGKFLGRLMGTSIDLLLFLSILLASDRATILCTCSELFQLINLSISISNGMISLCLELVIPLGTELLDFNKSYNRSLALSPVQTLLDCVTQQMEELERQRSAPSSGSANPFVLIAATKLPAAEGAGVSPSTPVSSHVALQDRPLGQQIYCYVLTRLLPDRELDAIDVAASEDPFAGPLKSGTNLVEYVALLLTETDCLLLRLCSCRPPSPERKRSRSLLAKSRNRKKLSHVASSSFLASAALLLKQKNSTASLNASVSSSLNKSTPDHLDDKNEPLPSLFPMLLLQSSLRLFEALILLEIESVVSYLLLYCYNCTAARQANELTFLLHFRCLVKTDSG